MESRALVRVLALCTIALLTLPAFAGLMDEAQITAQDAIFAEFRSSGLNVLEVSSCALTIVSAPGASAAVVCQAEIQSTASSETTSSQTCVVEITRTGRSFEAVSVACRLTRND